MRVEVVLVRHGETYWNRERRLQGQTDTELSDVGLDQARITGRFLRQKYPNGFVTAVSSDLQRARITAECIVADSNQLQLDPRLREIHLGVFQGKSVQECVQDPDLKECWGEYARNPYYVIPNGESENDLSTRSFRALEDLVLGVAEMDLEDTGKRVALLVAHGGVLCAMDRTLAKLGPGDRRRPIPNCSISVVEAFVEQGAVMDWKVKEWGLVHHLSAANQTASEVL
mmetsp:Transcript_19454/g.34695  ORF Transcript_19454/g.34695 Transcript_19454/m.34695 type:complete len:228 (-) Transcript_19454:281-964(-)